MAYPSLNVDPLIRGPFRGASVVSQITTNPDGFYTKDASDEWRGPVSIGRTMPQYAIGYRIPTAGQYARESYAFNTIPHNVVSVNQGKVNAFMPVFMAVGKFYGSGTINAAQVIGQAQYSPTEVQKWGIAYQDQSYNINTNGQTKYPLDFAGVRPECCYIWRSGVGMVGFIFSCRTIAALTDGPSRQNPLDSWHEEWGCHGYWVSTSSFGVKSVEPTHLRNRNYQDGDLLIVEYFGMSTLSAQSASANVGVCNLAGIVQIGGGTNHETTGATWDLGGDVGTPTQNTEIPIGVGTPPDIRTPDKPSKFQVSVGF